MPRRLITISYTGLDAGGGVPKFNRDLHSAFPDRECLHFCWADHPWHREVDQRGETEWIRARVLNQFLLSRGLVTRDVVVVADGFWASGLEHLPLAISHSHGIWSHLTHEDVLAGRQPDMPAHHAAQVAFRTRWRQQLGKPMTAVSDFIAHEMQAQWGLSVDAVIGNGVDLEEFRPRLRESIYANCNRPMVMHGVNDRFNSNKGWDHIELLARSLPNVEVVSLDEAYDRFQFYSDMPWTKALVLSQARLFVHPSAYEGNSMMVAEALACGLPFVGYNVGLMWTLQRELGFAGRVGAIIDRSIRSPETTLTWVKYILDSLASVDSEAVWLSQNARSAAEAYASLSRFRAGWRMYVEHLESIHA